MFIHLHNHSDHSLLQGLSKIPDLVARAKEYGMPALALTDYGNMYGAISFYKECRGVGIKPIIGIDGYMAFRGMEEKDHGIDNKRYPLTLLAKNETGYKNLMKIVSESCLRGMYYRPRFDKNLLQTYSDGIICMSGGMYSELGESVLTKNIDRAKSIIKTYQEIFPDNYYLEIMFNDHIDGLTDHNRLISQLSHETGAPLVATHNSHYLDPDDREAFDILLSVGRLGNANRGSGPVMRGDFAFYNSTEMERRFADYPEAVQNTNKIAAMCELELDLDSWHFPRPNLPDGETPDSELRRLTYLGIEKRGLQKTPLITERIDYELKIIQDKGYSAYFLVVADLLRTAREMKLYTNTRGSAAGSLVSYLSFITKVDPIKYDLPFERFLNPERPGIPDIDMDIADHGRDDVIQYLQDKYGKHAVARIGTFGTMLARGSIRDAARAMGYEYDRADRIARLVPPPHQGFPVPIDKALDEVPELDELYKNDTDSKRIIDMARKIEGCARHISIHAAGVVISPTGSVIDYSPIQYDPRGGKIITQYDMYTAGRDGVTNLPKFDILGIRNLSILNYAVENVQNRHGITVDLDNVNLEDNKTFEMLSAGHTVGVFQLSSGGMTRYLVDLQPGRVEDLNAMVALYRPGPMELIPEYIRRKHDSKLVQYDHEILEKILQNSYGIITYQDDVLLIAIKMAGYSWLEADKLRKAMGKKIPEMMQEQKEKFMSGCLANQIPEQTVSKLWEKIETFESYGFNKAHAASYGRIAYETAYMKANFTVEYMAAIMRAEGGDTDKIAPVIHECKKFNIRVSPPDINESMGDFTITSDTEIRFGLYSIKNFGTNIADIITTERERGGRFKNLSDLVLRIRHSNFNKKSLEALIMAGALDQFGGRVQLLENIERILDFSRDHARIDATQDNLFANTQHIEQNIVLLPGNNPENRKQYLAWEKELLGVYVSAHPLEQYREKFDNAKHKVESVLESGIDGQDIVIGGIITEYKEILTKAGERMAFITLEDFTGSIECAVFPRVLAATQIGEDSIVAIKGRVTTRDDVKSIVVNKVKILEKE